MPDNAKTHWRVLAYYNDYAEFSERSRMSKLVNELRDAVVKIKNGMEGGKVYQCTGLNQPCKPTFDAVTRFKDDPVYLCTNFFYPRNRKIDPDNERALTVIHELSHLFADTTDKALWTLDDTLGVATFIAGEDKISHGPVYKVPDGVEPEFPRPLVGIGPVHADTLAYFVYGFRP